MIPNVVDTMAIGGLESKPVGSYPPTGIDVLIVGTGLAGLTAAMECVRKGHSVRILERSATISTAGKLTIQTHIKMPVNMSKGDMYVLSGHEDQS